MWACLALLAFAAASQGSYIDNPSVESIYGSHILLYTWPKVNDNTSKCNNAAYSKPDTETDYTCQCQRESANLALIDEETFSIKYLLLVDVVEKDEDLQAALDDQCNCTPKISRHVIYKVNDDYFLKYELGQYARVYLFGNKVPTAEEMTELIEGVADLKDREGTLMCEKEESKEKSSESESAEE